jgi:hypothetical protein
MGHLALHIIHQVLFINQLVVSNNPLNNVSHFCQLGKSHKFSFYLSSSISECLLNLLFTYV